MRKTKATRPQTQILYFEDSSTISRWGYERRTSTNAIIGGLKPTEEIRESNFSMERVLQFHRMRGKRGQKGAGEVR